MSLTAAASGFVVFLLSVSGTVYLQLHSFFKRGILGKCGTEGHYVEISGSELCERQTSRNATNSSFVYNCGNSADGISFVCCCVNWTVSFNFVLCM